MADLKLKLEGFEAQLAGTITQPQLEGLLNDLYARQNASLNDLLQKYDSGIRAHIDEQVFKGVKLGIGEYDKVAKENFLTKGDAAAASAPGQGGATGRNFIDFLMGRVEDAFKPGQGGNANNDWMMDELATFKRVYENDLRLKFRNFLRSNYGVTEASGHVELSGEPGK